MGNDKMTVSGSTYKLLILLFWIQHALLQPDFLPCCRQSTDHNPNNMLEVYKKPQAYLCGPFTTIEENPFCTPDQKEQQHFVIVGGGIAGLTSARLLLSVGHKVTLLESSNRLGGRIFTVVKKPKDTPKWYGDMGAMRFPPDTQPIVNGLFDFHKENFQTATFADFNNRDQSYYFYNNTIFSGGVTGAFNTSAAPPDEETLEKLELFGISPEDLPRYENGTLVNPYALSQQLLENSFKDNSKLIELCRNDRSEAKFLDSNIKNSSLIPDDLAPEFLNFFNTFRGLTPYSTYSVLTILILARLNELPDENEQPQTKTPAAGSGRREIVNGTFHLVDTIEKECEEFGEFGDRFKLEMKSTVTKIKHNENGVTVLYKKKGNGKGKMKMKKIKGDKVIVTPTAKIVSNLEFDPPLPLRKQNAMESIFYFSSAQVFLNFKTPFWADIPNNVPRIPFDDDQVGVPPSKSNDSTINGAVCISDDFLKQTYYPSHSFHGNSLLVSYTFDKDSQFYSGLSDKEIVDLSLDALERRHGKVVRQNFDMKNWKDNSAIQVWDLDNHFHSAFMEYGVQQRNMYLEELLSNEGNVIIAGESSNKFHNGWVEAALESSIRNLIKLRPEAYDSVFGEGERLEYDGEGVCKLI